MAHLSSSAVAQKVSPMRSGGVDKMNLPSIKGGWVIVNSRASSGLGSPGRNRLGGRHRRYFDLDRDSVVKT